MQNSTKYWPVFLRQNINTEWSEILLVMKSFEASILKYLEFLLVEWTQLYHIYTWTPNVAKPKSGAPDYLPWLEPAIQSKTSTWTAVNSLKL